MRSVLLLDHRFTTIMILILSCSAFSDLCYILIVIVASHVTTQMFVFPSRSVLCGIRAVTGVFWGFFVFVFLVSSYPLYFGGSWKMKYQGFLIA